MEKENKTDESDFNKNEIPDLNSLKLFECKLKQTSEILTVVAVLMRKKVLKVKWIETASGASSVNSANQ